MDIGDETMVTNILFKDYVENTFYDEFFASV
jgi:hypothetical protein